MTQYDIESEIEDVRLAIINVWQNSSNHVGSYLDTEEMARAALKASKLPHELEIAEVIIEELDNSLKACLAVLQLLMKTAERRPTLAKEMALLDVDLLPIINKFNLTNS